MGRKLHDQALTLTCTGATDAGSGVYEYIIYALRATIKGASAPADSQANFDAAVEIGRIGNLSNTQGYTSYASSNQYKYKWYNWENGYSYRIWTMAVDKAGNIESYDGSGNTFATPVLLDSRPPQFIATYSGNRIPYNCIQKSNTQPWTFTKSAGSAYFIVTADNGQYPQWFTNPGAGNLANYWLVFYSAASSPNFVYFAQIQSNDDNVGSSQDRIQVYCSATNPIYKLDISGGANDGDITLITAIANVVDNSAVEWASGKAVVVKRPIVTCGIGTMTVEFDGVDSNVADLDHYKIERYVQNQKTPTYPTHYGFSLVTQIEDTKFVDYNKRWDKAKVVNWVNGTSQYSDAKVYCRGLYKITPVDVFGNEGYPTLSFDYTNVDGFFPVTGTPPGDIANKSATSDNDGNITLEWDAPTDDDLRGFQIARRRGVYGSGTDTDPANYTWDSWELITEQDAGEFETGSTYAKKYRDVNLEPFSTVLRPEKVAYQYRIRATDYSGNTSLNWVDFSANVVKAVDTTVSTTGSGLTATGKIGSITLTVTQPSDNKSVKVHIYRSVGNNTSYEATPFKVVELPPSGAMTTQDEKPPVDAEMLIYYKQKFEDQWGNQSGFVNETSATSKTAATAGDSTPPYVPDRIAAYYDEAEAVNRISFRRPNKKNLAGTVAITNGSPTVTGTSTTFTTDFSNGEKIQFIGTSGGDVSYSITTVDSDTQITLSKNVAENTAAGLSYRGSVDYAGAILFKRRRYADGTFGDPVVVKEIGSSQVDSVEDKALIIGEWQYLVSARDTYNNESGMGNQDDNGFNLDIIVDTIKDVMIYNTSIDTVSGLWKVDDTKSWFTVGKFPEVCGIVVATDSVYLIDMKDATVYMTFNGTNGYMLSLGTGNREFSGVSAINGKIAISVNNSTTGNSELYVIDFPNDMCWKYDETGRQESNTNIANRNSVTTYGNVDAAFSLVDDRINAVHSVVI